MKKRFDHKLARRTRRSPWFRRLGLTLVVAILLAAICDSRRTANADDTDKKAAIDETGALIESALYGRAEFFGAQALVPYPTEEARVRLAALQAKYPDEPRVLLRLSQLDEKLGHQDEALKEMRAFVDHSPDKIEALDSLAAFSHRRAQFAAEAETLEQLLKVAPPERRVAIFREIITLAQTHLLEKYLAPSFYDQTLAENPSAFEIIEQYLDKLTEQEKYAEALKVVRQYKDHFSDRREPIIEKEVSLLDHLGEEKEAERVYIKAFDPFWSADLSEKFYAFLKDNDRFRAYGRELREAFHRNPADFDTAVRLLHYSKNAGDDLPDVFVQLEKARAARHIVWKQDELVTITRLLLAQGYGDAASRFLYTLYLQGEMKPGSEVRAKILYQLFEVLSDAGAQRLSLTHGDLKFYQDIATADPHPGMLGGILSLVLSDTNPKKEFQVEESRAAAHFNRAAAYGIFTAYKQEFPTSPELAQMYLDIVRLYTATKELSVAGETLAEFEKRYADAPHYPEVALKLADCYIAAGKYDDERALYQRILDYLGQHRQKGTQLVPSSEQSRIHVQSGQPNQALDIDAEPTNVKPASAAYPPISNPGIEASSAPNVGADGYGSSNDRSESGYPDYLGSSSVNEVSDDKEDSATEASQSGTVDYPLVLMRYVASLAKDNRTSDILALYSNEIKKYGDEQGLYEQRLQWLGQTNLVDEQLRVYQEALKKFPTMIWRDRLARWFLRQSRSEEFAALSRDLLAKVNDAEAETYLRKFVDSSVQAKAASFDANLYVALYSLAHQRFPHNLNLVNGLLKFYSAHDQWAQWRTLVAEYYFESRDIREQFLQYLASHGELRGKFDAARDVINRGSQNSNAQTILPYRLFYADAAARLSNYEEAIDAYRELNRLYPNTPEFADRLVNFTRSLGQHSSKFLEESAATAHALADAVPSSPEYRTRAGEIQAELGNYTRAREEWEQLIPLGRGVPDTYLETATVYWDYFQYDDALRTIKNLRQQTKNETLYAFQAAVILEDKHQLQAALGEYMKALAAVDWRNDGVADKARANRRLVTLSKRPGVYEQIVAAFNQERRRQTFSEFTLEYATFLDKAKRWSTASTVLRQEAARTDSSYFLEHARDLFEEHKEPDGQAMALRRLAVISRAPRIEISYRLQLAGVHQRAHQTAQAATVLRALVQKYPTNYGVLTEAADFYWRLGLRPNSVAILQAGMQRGLGKFHYSFGRQLAARQLEMNRPAAAERVLEQLHREDRLNAEVFHELAKLYVHTGNQEALRKSFNETVAAIKDQDIDLKEIHNEVAEFRREMIDAFTRLKDYSSAIEQHIEIINRDPDDETEVEAAINYVKRYGGGDTLLNYYQKTAQQAYKNYRWNVVLARIYEAKGDFANAAKQYRVGLDNQPEMTELYDSLADVYTRAKDYNAALAALRKAEELSNDDPQYIKRVIEVLEKAGRHHEADIERQKLPHEEQKKLNVSDQFAEAARLRGSERKRAVETYRQAFNAFSADPLKHDLKSAEIAGYVQTVRDEEPLDQITNRLWELRVRLVAEGARANSEQSGKAKSLVEVLDGAVAESVGGLAAERATGEELSGLFKFLKEHTEATLRTSGDQKATRSFLENLSRRAGLGSIEETVLISLRDRDYAAIDWPAYHGRVQALVDFYDERGAYRRIVDLLVAERARDRMRDQFDYPRLLATNARLIGDSARELDALRENYQKPNTNVGALPTSADPLIERYFAALYENGEAGKSELLSCAQHPTWHQLQLVNFLLRKGDRQVAHEAIENSPLPLAWKLSRNAEISLELSEFDQRNGDYFVNALQFQPIGELIKAKPDTTRQLVGDDWFHLTQTYGQWLYASSSADQKAKSRAFLPAMIENRPQDNNEQARLGRWYLERKDVEHALAHLELAIEAQPDDKRILADLGSAYFLRGDRRKADEFWEQIIAEKASVDDYQLYLDTLVKHELREEARKRLTPFVTKSLESEYQEDRSYSSEEWRAEFEKFKGLIRALAGSFADPHLGAARDNNSTVKLSPATEAAKAKSLINLCVAAPKNRFLPELLIRESLVATDEMGPLYQIAIKRNSGLTSYDHDSAYVALQEKVFDESQLEQALDQESDYKPSEPGSEKIKWQMEYLDYLIDRKQNGEARTVIAAIDGEIKHRYARPAWLRLATLRLDIRGGRAAQTIDALQRLIGIKTSENLNEVKPPSIERLNDAVTLLRSEGHETEARALLEAAYARELALSQYEPAYFAGLATAAFESGDAKLGLNWLQLMVDRANPELKDETENAVSGMPLIKAHAVETPGIDLPSASGGFDSAKALRLAAETAGEFTQFDAAIGYRQQLLTTSLDDEENRIELVRLLAANQKPDEAIQNLANIIGDRTATRNARWQAVWLATEIAGQKPERWTSLRDRVRSLNAKDTEMAAALEALSLSSGGRVDEGIKAIAAVETGDPNPSLRVLRAFLEKKNGDAVGSMNSFTNALIDARDSRPWQAFDFLEDDPTIQIVRLYLQQNEPRAALKVADRITALQPKQGANEETDEADEADGTDEPAVSDSPPVVREKYQTLRSRATARTQASRAELLRLLSIAAEGIGDLKRAAELEQARVALLIKASDKQTAQLRIEKLRDAQRAVERQRKSPIVIDQKNV